MRPLLLLIIFLAHTALFAENLSVGIVPFGPPFEMVADQKDHFIGFDIDLMMETCKRIQATCRFIPLSFSDLFSQTLSGKIDLAISAISITAERRQYYLFSMPYLASSGHFVTTTSSSISTLEDIRDKQVGIVRGTIFGRLTQELFNQSVTTEEFTSVSDLFEALSDEVVDIILLDNATAHYWVANNSQYKLVATELPIGIGYGIMTNQQNGALIKRVNEALTSMQNDGMYLKIYNRYFSPLTTARLTA